MTIDLDRLKELFQGYVASKRPPSRRDCPDPAAIAGSFEPGASRRRKKKIIEHVAQCPFCREEFMMLVERHAGETDVSEAAADSMEDPHALAGIGPGRRSRTAWRFAAAMLGLGLMISSFVVVLRQRDRREVLRGGEAAILLLAPKSDQTVSGPPLCRWKARTAVDYYVVELFDEALLPIWTSDPARGNELRIPSEVYAGLRPGQRCFWMVTGYSGQGPMGESQMGRFIVSR